MPEHDQTSGSGSRDDTESSIELLNRARSGDERALEHLCARYVPRLRRWAHGQVPRRARAVVDTDDLVQETLLRTVRQVDNLRSEHQGAFHVYVRTVLRNRIRDHLRKAQRTPDQTRSMSAEVAPDPTPLEAAIGKDVLERYERALARLDVHDREAVVVRIELGLSYADAATALGKPSPDAARMAVGRALYRLAREMGHE